MTETSEPAPHGAQPDNLAQALQALVDTPDLEEKRRILETEPALLSEASAVQIDGRATRQPTPDLQAYVAAHATLIRQALAEGFAQAWAAFEADSNVRARMRHALTERLVAVLNLKTWEEIRAALEADPELISDTALQMLEDIRDAHDHPKDNIHVQKHIELFKRAREIGIDAAFADRHAVPGGPRHGIGAPLACLLAEISELADDSLRAADVVALCDRALPLLRRPAQDPLWAALQNMRADALASVGALAGDPGILQAAVAGFNAALDVFAREADAAAWGETQAQRAGALSRLGELAGDPDLLREALAGFNAALAVIKRAAMPARWATMQKVRAGALVRLGEMAGDPGRLSEAVAACDAALMILTREANAYSWATAQQNRAAALLRLGVFAGDPGLLREAAAGFDAALATLNREADAADRVENQQNRASALMHLGDLASDPSLLREAVAGHDAALKDLTKEANPVQWARIQSNRGTALQRLGELAGDPAVLRAAVAGFDAALEVRTKAAMPAAWAATHVNRAAAFLCLWEVTGDVSHLEAALADWRAALEVLTMASAPDQAMGVVVGLSGALFALGRWGELAEVADPALASGQRMLSGLGRSAREQAVARAADLADLRAWAELELGGDAGAALRIADGGRARLLALGLGADPLQAALEGAAGATELSAAQRDEIQAIRDRRDGARARLGRPIDTGGLTGAAAAARAAEIEAGLRAGLEAALAEEEAFRAAHGLTRPEPAPLVLAAAVPPGGAAAMLLVTPAGARALVLADAPAESAPGGAAGRTAGDARDRPEALAQDRASVTVLELPGLDSETLRAWLFGPKGEPGLGGHLGAYQDWQRAHAEWRRRPDDRIARGEMALALDTFSAGIETLLGRIWTQLLGPLDAHLRGLGLAEGAEVALLPPGLLSLLPLGAAAPGPGAAPFAAHWQVSLAPSLTALAAARARRDAWRETRGGRFARVAAALDPAGDDHSHDGGPGGGSSDAAGSDALPASRAEAPLLAGLFPARGALACRIGGDATLAAVLADLAAADLAHLSTHGRHDFNRPDRSGLMMAGGEVLTLGMLVAGARLPCLRLAVLSACESGLVGLGRASEEFIGLPAGWLQAGAAGVLASHWPVADAATHLLLMRFYEEYLDETGRERCPPARALAGAAGWLRGVRNADLAALLEPLRHDATSSGDPASPGAVVPRTLLLGRRRLTPIAPDAAWAEVATIPQVQARTGAADPDRATRPAAAGWKGRAAQLRRRVEALRIGGLGRPGRETTVAAARAAEAGDPAWSAADRARVTAARDALLVLSDGPDHQPFAHPRHWAAFSITGL